ncbi:hypothetical protein AXG93_2507s1200 [Marchantia polymorpha subsp. ruderalis]|uniref:Uncharacterized protein n=1 Tax=Marchantia polymorpha subsp. ruderalis TaxID=1480154 RepID=A0A176W5J6_MARPO|nr:hypothetical protein AXG93_2507s1200 [Marchantia polymorpha subsp. ruderalis]
MGSSHKKKVSELEKINDPNFIIELAVGPPIAELVPQNPAAGDGVTLGGKFLNKPSRFIFKKAHLTADDNRIFDADTGQLVCVSHHYGKNPYESLDPLGISGQNDYWQRSHILGEWESVCHVTGYRGMPSFKVRPKTFSVHGRQYIQDNRGEHTFFNIAKQSRMKSMSIRHNLVVCKGETEDDVYAILVDMAGRTMQVVNEKEERVAHIEKSMKTLLMNAALGAGSELMIDIAPGVDWTAILAIVIGLKQEVAGDAGHITDQAIRSLNVFQQIMREFYH